MLFVADLSESIRRRVVDVDDDDTTAIAESQPGHDTRTTAQYDSFIAASAWDP